MGLQGCQDPQEPHLKTSSLDHLELLGKMVEMERGVQPAHPELMGTLEYQG